MIKSSNRPTWQGSFTAFRKYDQKQATKGNISQQYWFKSLITLAFCNGLRVTNTQNDRVGARVPIFEPLYWRLKAWYKFTVESQKGLVFTSPASKPEWQYPFSGNYVSSLFKFYFRQVHFKESLHFHGMRHSRATFLLRSGFNVIEVKNIRIAHPAGK